MANTLAHHAQAASNFLTSIMSQSFSMYTEVGSKRTWVPFIADKIDQRRKWQKPRPKREAYTMDMFETFYQQVSRAEKQDPSTFTSKNSLIFDTQCLGLFTGSRVSEYCQSKGSRNSVSRVPVQPGCPPSSGLPIAFIASDFVFLSKEGTILPHTTVFSNSASAHQLQITFRHDKSGRNGTVRKFGRGGPWLCPVRAATRLLYRAYKLSIAPLDPICAYRPDGHSMPRYLRDTDVTTTMRAICIATYPEDGHFLRLNIDRIASHSLRVTAAVALSQTNMSIDDIAQRLRWKPESVAFYLRESARDVGNYTANAVLGAQRQFC